MNILYIIKDLYFCNFDLQKWVNNRFHDNNKYILYKNGLSHIVTKEGLSFYPPNLEIVGWVLNEYEFDIKSDDVVLDLGANIGAFSLRAALKGKHVYAVEPLFTKELHENIIANGLQDKITVLPIALGKGDVVTLSYDNRKKVIQTYTLTEILDMIGDPVTFMKCDIEGSERFIKTYELSDIDSIELETHENQDTLIYFIEQNWVTTKNKKESPNKGYYIHARRENGREGNQPAKNTYY